LRKEIEWPRISIITPSYNQGSFIEETILSVLDQNYPNLEYFVIDGGSNDNTVEVIKKYESKITYWVSEKDKGQTHAINKGLAKATGDIIAYINSDDYYLPGSFRLVAEEFLKNPNAGIIHGICRYVNERGDKIGLQQASITRFDEILDLWGVWWRGRNFVQPEVFWTKKAFTNAGFFNEKLYYVMDYEYWLRILKNKGEVITINQELTCFRRTDTQKSTQSNSKKVADELLDVVYPYYREKGALDNTKRRALMGNRNYQKYFLTKIEESVKSGDASFIRWLKLLSVLSVHPEIVYSQLFKQKINTYFN
jgi:glycosyltransferase involved in cell wall biosynthesis